MPNETSKTAPGTELTRVRQDLERLAEAVVAQMRALQEAVARRDLEALGAIVARDGEIDDIEMRVAKQCRCFMELRAPLGPDFRYVMGAIDIARNLERIGDCIEYVARHVAESMPMHTEFSEGAYQISTMIDKVREILETAFFSWQRNDALLAGRIPEQDNFVDAIQERVYSLVVNEVRAGKVDVELGMMAMLISNKLEAIADIACHIAETVVFMIQARQIRHEARA